MTLRDELEKDQRASAEPRQVLDFLQKLSPEDWTTLMAALQKGDEQAAAKVFGLTPEQMKEGFEKLKLRTQDIVNAHPDVLDLTKR